MASDDQDARFRSSAIGQNGRRQSPSQQAAGDCGARVSQDGVLVTRRNVVGAAASVSACGLIADHGNEPLDVDVGATPLRVGLIGCGGRGTVAAAKILDIDQGARIVAMADQSSTSLAFASDMLARNHGGRGVCPNKARFSGEDGWRGVFDEHPDLVILATPAAVRPSQIETAVANRVHMFVERPLAASLEAVERLQSTVANVTKHGLVVVSAMVLRRDQTVQSAVTSLGNPSSGSSLAMRGGSSLIVAYPSPRRAKGGIARWSVAELVVDAVDVARWVTGDQKVVAVRSSSCDGGDFGPDIMMELQDGGCVRLVPNRRSRFQAATLDSSRTLPAEGRDPGRWLGAFKQLVTDVRSGCSRVDAADELSRLLEATRVAILAADAANA